MEVADAPAGGVGGRHARGVDVHLRTSLALLGPTFVHGLRPDSIPGNRLHTGDDIDLDCGHPAGLERLRNASPGQ